MWPIQSIGSVTGEGCVGEYRRDEELPPWVKKRGSQPCSKNEYWEVGGYDRLGEGKR